MSPSLLIAGIAAAVAFGPAAHAVVVITALPSPLNLHDDFFGSFEPIDVDGNGTVDFTFGYDFSAVGIRTERDNRIVISIDSPPNIGGPPYSIPVGYMIGSTLVSSGSDVTTWSSSDFLGMYVSPDENSFIGIVLVLNTGSTSSFDGRGAIGIEFKGVDGIHYGYIDIEAGAGYAGITLFGWAYESQPGVSILASQVPEASTLMLAGVATASLLLRRRRE